MAAKPLHQELKKKRPFDSPEQEAAISILRTNDLLHNQFLRLFRPFGLTPSQYNVLRILRGEGRPLPCQEIAGRMIQVVPAMTGLIDRLEQQQLVQRERSEEDRRVIFVAITAKGRELLSEIDQPLLDLHHRLLGHLSCSELQELNRLLQKARERAMPEAD